ncbi:MAG: LysM peptidoglycan-binding domain-containing protein [Candidatus Korobacteraceae bacterium]
MDPTKRHAFWGAMRRNCFSWFIIGSLIFALAACSSSGGKKSGGASPPSQATAPELAAAPPAREELPPPPQIDHVEALIAQVEEAYQSGKASYAAGHVDAARTSFDRAFNLLLNSEFELRKDDRLLREFEKVVEQVQALEIASLKAGDGFTEQRSEPAPIDEASTVTFPVDPTVRAQAEHTVRVTSSDLPLMVTDEVASFISFYSTRGRGTLERALIRSGRYRGMILKILEEEGVPQDLIYLAQAESGFIPLALSRAGARGMWQFIASRASEYGLKRNWWLDERQDPEKATRAAARHLRDLYNQFGDWYLAMAAYNSGPGTVQQAVQRTGHADFWELYRRRVLPAETKNYVPIILAIILMTKNPEEYGLDFLELERPEETELVPLDSAVDLRLVAECADTTVSKLQELNPGLLRMTTPREGNYELRVPAGTAARVTKVIASIPPDMRVWWRYHKAASGETLSEIAQQYRTTVDAIREVNNLPGEDVWTEQRLIIPLTPGKATERERVAFSKTPTRYKVRRGDTVLSVADDFGVPPERVRSWNGIKGNRLVAGRTLRIYRPVASAARAQGKVAKSSSTNNLAETSASGEIRHRVRPGETLYEIASRYNTTVSALQRDNKITSLIRPGDVVVVRPAAQSR